MTGAPIFGARHNKAKTTAPRDVVGEIITNLGRPGADCGKLCETPGVVAEAVTGIIEPP
jgi:hypothetical protein